MRRGPKPQATTPQGIRGIPPCPAHLDRAAKAHWNKVTKLLDDLGVLSLSDGDALEIYCTLYSRWRKAEEMLREEGYVVATGTGSTKQNPWLSISTVTINQMLAIMGTMGLNASARAKVNALSKEDESELKWKGFIDG